MRTSRRSANSVRSTGTFGDFGFGGGLYTVTNRNSSRPTLTKQLMCFITATEMDSRKIMATPASLALARGMCFIAYPGGTTSVLAAVTFTGIVLVTWHCVRPSVVPLWVGIVQEMPSCLRSL